MTGAPWYLDCDTGIDDALTLGLLVAEGADLRGIGSVSGNLSAAGGARNTLDLMALMGRPDVPVAVGAHDPIGGVFGGGAAFVHGENGIGDVVLPRAGEPVQESAAEMLVRLAHEHPGALRVLAVGPLTNLALALRDRARPAVARRRRRDHGRRGARARQRLRGRRGEHLERPGRPPRRCSQASWPVTVVGLDVTMEARFEEHAPRRAAGRRRRAQGARGDARRVLRLLHADLRPAAPARCTTRSRPRSRSAPWCRRWRRWCRSRSTTTDGPRPRPDARRPAQPVRRLPAADGTRHRVVLRSPRASATRCWSRCSACPERTAPRLRRGGGAGPLRNQAACSARSSRCVRITRSRSGARSRSATARGAGSNTHSAPSGAPSGPSIR